MSRPAIGVDVGGTKVLGVVVDAAGRVLAEERRPTPTESPEELCATIEEVVSVLGADGEWRDAPIGVGLPGLVDRGGVLRFSPHLPAARGLDLRAHWPSRWPGPRVVNDAAAAARAEGAWGAGRGLDDFLFVALGTGIGGALVRDGVVRAGPRGFAGEYGHMVVDPGGVVCPCGGRGCWERYASAAGLERFERAAGGSGEGGGPGVVARARALDQTALTALTSLAAWLALGVANLIAALDVTDVVVGGGLAREGDLFLPTAAARLADLLEGASARPPTRWHLAGCGESAGALGAGLVAREGS